MKVSIDVDCTPEEARRFLGLPDLGPVHDVYVSKMQKLVEDGLTGEGVMEMVKQWGPMTEAGMTAWRQMFDQMSGKR
jgi:hypothetical protein